MPTTLDRPTSFIRALSSSPVSAQNSMPGRFLDLTMKGSYLHRQGRWQRVSRLSAGGLEGQTWAWLGYSPHGAWQGMLQAAAAAQQTM